MQPQQHQVCILDVNYLPHDIKSQEVFKDLQEDLRFLIIKVRIFSGPYDISKFKGSQKKHSLIRMAKQGAEQVLKVEKSKNNTRTLKNFPTGDYIRFNAKENSRYSLKTFAGRSSLHYNDYSEKQKEDEKQIERNSKDKKPISYKFAKVYVIGEPKEVKKIYRNFRVNIRMKAKPLCYRGYEGKEKVFNQETKRVNLECKDMEYGIWNPNNPIEFMNYVEQARPLPIAEGFAGMYPADDEDIYDFFDYGDDIDIDDGVYTIGGGTQLTYFLGSKKFEKNIIIEKNISREGCGYLMITKLYSTHFTFDMIRKVHLETNKDNKVTLYLEVDEYARFWVEIIEDEEHSKVTRVYNSPLWSIHDNLLKLYAAQSTVIKLALDAGKNLEDFLNQMISVGIEVVRYAGKTFEHIYRKPFLTYDILSQCALPYSIKYALLACLSQKRINLFHISEDFLIALEDGELDGKPLNNNVIENTLNDIGNQNRAILKIGIGQSSMKDFQEAFWKLYLENERNQKHWKNNDVVNDFIKTKRVSISPMKTIYYLPEAELSNSVLRRHRDYSDEFLRVSFTGDRSSRIQHIPKETVKEVLSGFNILTKNFKFLAFSSSQLRNSSLWMLAESSRLTVEGIYKEIGDLSAIQIPAKHGARLGQLFSSSTPGIQIDKNIIDLREIPDITVLNATKDGKYTFSDGIGKISSNLMRAIKHNLKKEGYMSAIQIRHGGNKGVLVEDPKLTPNTICFRPSMIKFTNSTFDSCLEVLDQCRYLPAYLNRQIIILLLTNELCDEGITQLAEENIADLSRNDMIEKVIWEYINNKHQYTYLRKILTNSIENGISIMNEPFLSGIVETIRVRSFMNLRDKCSIYIKKGVRLMGVLDEYNVLKYGQVYACISPSNGEKPDDLFILTGRLLVTKNPCLHPGDIKVLEGVNNEETKKKLKHLVNCVVFPAQGPRPHTDEISGSDLDGDVYFLSWDERLIPDSTYPSMSYTAAATEKQPVTTEKIIDFFADYIHSDILGKIDNGHLAFADKSDSRAKCDVCINLAIKHSEAVDYAKTGVCPTLNKDEIPEKWPDYMEKPKKKSYRSTTIIGDIYRSVRTLMEKIGIDESYKDGSKIQKKDILIDESMIYEGFEHYLEEAFGVLSEYYKDIEKIKSIYKLQTEYEIYSGSFLRFLSLNKQKAINLEKLQQSVFHQFQELKRKFWRILRETTDIDLNSKQELEKKAFACYIASYYNTKCQNEKILRALEHIEHQKKFKLFFESFNQQYLGLPWLVFKDELLIMKKRSYS